MVKRFLSIIIAVCLLAGTYIPVAADDTLVIHENVIFDLQSYGILLGEESGDLALDRSVTRAEFCAFIVRLTGIGSLPYVERFSDVPGEAWYAQDISTLVSYGLIDGNENGEFKPDDTITFSEAMKILVCALGYEVVAIEAGGYPDGYVQTGRKLKLDEGVYASYEDFLTRGAVVLMLYNALDVKILEPTQFGENVTYEESDKTFRSNFGSKYNSEPIRMATGIVTANYYTFLLNPISNIEIDEVEINGTVYKDGNTNTKMLLGAEVEYYYIDNENETPTIIRSRLTDNNNIVSLEGEDICSALPDQWVYNDEKTNKEIKLNLSDSFLIMKNYNILAKPYTFATGYDICKNGFISVIDNDGDKLYDLAIVEDYNSYRIGKVSEKGLYIADEKLFDGKRFVNMDTEDDDVKIILENSDGEPIALNDIEEEDVVSLLLSADKSVLKCIKGNAAVSGTLSAISDDDKFYIDEESYEVDYYFINESNVGDTVKAYLDFKGCIVELEPDKSSGKNYAYILFGKTQSGIDNTFQLKVLIPGQLKPEVEIDDTDEDNIVEVPVLKAYNRSVEVLTLAEKISFDGTRMTSQEYSALFSEANLTANPDKRLISYKTNSDGVITRIESTERIGDGSYKVYNAYENVFGKEGNKAFGITEESKVVCVPPTITSSFSDDNYYVSLLMNNSERYRITGYDIDSDSSNADIVVITETMDLNAGEVINKNSKLAVVSNISYVIDEKDDEEKIKLEFYSEGKRMEYYIANDSEASSVAASIKFGDVFYYALNNVDEVYKLNICDLGQLGGELIYGDRGSDDVERSILGELTDIDYNIIDLYKNRRVNRLTVSIDESLAKVTYNVNRRNTPHIYLIDNRKKTVEVGNIDDIYIGAGAIFAHIKEGSLKGIVIVK